VPAALVSPTGTVYEAGAQMAQKKCAFFDVTLTMDTAIHLRCGRGDGRTQVISNVFQSTSIT
jgi:hypothetical protein